MDTDVTYNSSEKQKSPAQVPFGSENLLKWKAFFEIVTKSAGVAYMCAFIVYVSYFLKIKLPLSYFELFDSKDYLVFFCSSFIILMSFIGVLLLPSVAILDVNSRKDKENKEDKEDRIRFARIRRFFITNKRSKNLGNWLFFVLFVGFYTYLVYLVLCHRFKYIHDHNVIAWISLFGLLTVIYGSLAYKQQIFYIVMLFVSVGVAINQPAMLLRITDYGDINRYIVYDKKPTTAISQYLKLKRINTIDGPVWMNESSAKIALKIKNNLVFNCSTSSTRPVFITTKREGVHLFNNKPCFVIYSSAKNKNNGHSRAKRSNGTAKHYHCIKYGCGCVENMDTDLTCIDKMTACSKELINSPAKRKLDGDMSEILDRKSQ